jgi:sigma-B regulation protein RsbU (phosphoserine phosphatase)
MQTSGQNIRKIFIIITFSLVWTESALSAPTRVIKGKIDTSGIESLKKEPIALDGEWDFFWNLARGEEKIITNSNQTYITVPGAWNKINTYPKKGYAIYQIQIQTKDKEGIYALKIYEFPQSYKLYVNGKLLHENGIYSTDLTQIKRSLVRPVVLFPLTGQTTLIQIHVSNLDEENPGPRKSLLFGSQESILNLQDSQHVSDMFSLGILTIMSLYHFGLYIQRRKDNGSLIFALFCLVISFRIFVTEEHYIQKYFPSFPSTLERICDVGTFFALTPLLVALFHQLFKNEFRQKLYLPFQLSLLSIATLYLVTRYEPFFQLSLAISLIIGLYLTYILILGIKNKKFGSSIFFLGWVIFLSTAAFDIIAYNHWIRANYVSHIGFLFFIFAQAFYLSIRFNRALTLSEELTETLEIKVKERTNQLNESLSLIQSDLQLAKKLQESLFHMGTIEIKDIEIASRYLPQSEVGGDIFDVRVLGENKIRLFIADATGHGVQAALVTMMIKSECDLYLTENIPVNSILYLINNSFTKKYANLNLFFSAFICDLDFNEKTISFASAGHPDQYLIRKNEIYTMKVKGRLIGIHLEESFESQTLPLLEGDSVLLFSDGIYEDFDEKENMYGELKFRELVKENSHYTAEALISNIISAKETFKAGVPRTDDITLIAVKWKNKHI